ncbi:MAG: L-2-amino-thiazoline-4-carboxylic acid hydrolase [Candidatus Aminicenantes bacterium]|nr:MAG: L-2-amino-thiazoline-4-carboxylic acid hydrolase [Candidatus Aminicenantes bacterium]
MRQSSNLVSSRRQFLKNVLPAGTLLCFGGNQLLALGQAEKTEEAKPVRHKFLEKSDWTYKQIYDFVYRAVFIPDIEYIANEVGRDKLIEMLKRKHLKNYEKYQKEWEKEPTEDDIKNRIVNFKKAMANKFWKHVVTYEILEESGNSFRYKVTECLWAETFQSAKFSDIGYAAVCYGDLVPFIQPRNKPRINLIRPTTLMQGNECCDFKYILEV